MDVESFFVQRSASNLSQAHSWCCALDNIAPTLMQELSACSCSGLTLERANVAEST